MEEPCPLEGLFANCYRLVDGVLVEATALINPCHDPMDVTFIIESKHPAVTWQHTFITSNLGERVIMPQLGLRTDLMLDINMQKSRLNGRNDTYSLQVSFVGLRNELLGTFLRSDFSLRSAKTDCFGHPIGFYVYIIAAVCLSVLFVVMVGILWHSVYKRMKQKANSKSLVQNMEPQATSSIKPAASDNLRGTGPQVEFRSSENGGSTDEPSVYMITNSGTEHLRNDGLAIQLS